jgi:hypothetical protein
MQEKRYKITTEITTDTSKEEVKAEIIDLLMLEDDEAATLIVEEIPNVASQGI